MDRTDRTLVTWVLAVLSVMATLLRHDGGIVILFAIIIGVALTLKEWLTEIIE